MKHMIRKDEKIRACVTGIIMLTVNSCAMTADDTVYGTSERQSLGKKDGIIADFEQIDDGDGVLSWAEIENVYGEQLVALDWSKGDVFRMFAQDEDKYLDRNEYRNFRAGVNVELGYESHRSDAGAKNEGYFSFDDIDADNDGLIGTEEFGDAGLSTDFSLFDDSADGYLQEHEFQTLKKALGIDETERYGNAVPSERLSFDVVDVDGNGFVGAEELEGAGVNAERRYRLFDDNEDGVLDKTEYLEYLGSL